MSQIFNLWLASIKQYLLISFFSSHPGRLPKCSPCLVLTISAYFLIVALLLATALNFFSLLVQVILEIIMLTILAYGTLRFRHKLERLEQTVSALIGTNLVVTTMSAFILYLIAPEMLSANVDTEKISPSVLNFTLLMLVWNLAIISLIFKRALEIRTFGASLIAINYFLLYEFLVVGILDLK